MSQPARHTVIDEWTGRHACALQAAFRMSQDEMAALIGVAKRTIAAWHERPEVRIRPELQRALDTAYERSAESVKIRFARQLNAEDRADVEAAGSAAPLTVAIAVVVNGARVLLVCRREDDPNGITWQFPAGIVKPGAKPRTVAVRETLAETGIHCTVMRPLGSRIHPVTGVFAEYFLCSYLTGEVANRDTDENIDAVWIPRQRLGEFVPADRVFPPVIQALEDLEAEP
ncbi:NUDIX hydrolase [Catenuloplanes atrovinosus]|uniref:8-oxo-dGTP pyrophosphatase MutT (NUDIX family)/DNA-binding XRE family transcriptional regulator n=1 Tax=Catenuloplanes atrovinosus TaxID=137266 RepID=A0AAE4CBR3_9ACTN|nr:NUDIX hydrolase [Catenuloplanes atrovinosus]MDR7278383.1 8-oxo-dGTP pyrophosphatase MutT (NUDIX family)/DNA-binding XRE family transcriptional regulator [Catenuloplanes atrovinosus]